MKQHIFNVAEVLNELFWYILHLGKKYKNISNKQNTNVFIYLFTNGKFTRNLYGRKYGRKFFSSQI